MHASDKSNSSLRAPSERVERDDDMRRQRVDRVVLATLRFSHAVHARPRRKTPRGIRSGARRVSLGATGVPQSCL